LRHSVITRRDAEFSAEAADEVTEVAETDCERDVRDARVLEIRAPEPLCRRVDAPLEDVASWREAHFAEDALDTASAHVELFGDPADVQVRIRKVSFDEGAGFTLRPDLLFAEVAEDFRAYALGNEHRHLPEMRAIVKALGGDNDLIFVPHLLPVARGILATITVPVREAIANPLEIWEQEYAGEPFVEVTSSAPSLRDVVRRNVVRVSVTNAAQVRQPTLIVIAAIDNLMKGAAGQAVQNANLMLGIPEPMGLPL